VKSKDLRLLFSLGSSRKLFFGALLGAFINTAIIIANALLISAVIVGLIYRHPTLTQHIASLAGLWVFRAVFISQFDRWASVQASHLKDELRSSIIENPSAIAAIPATHLTTLLVKGANSLDIYLARFMPQMFGAAFTPLAVIATIASLDLLSALITFITLPLIPFFGALIGRYTNDAVAAKWQSLGTLSKYFEDSLRGIFTLAIFGRHKSQGPRIQEMGDRYTDETMKVLRVSFLSALVLELAATISVALIAVEIGLRLVGGSMEFFPALVILVLAPEVYFPLRNAASLFHASADGGAALAEITSLSSSSPEQSLTVGEVQATEIKEIAWIDWRSPFGSGALPGHHLSKGQALVMRGGSGLGKTTFLNSILGFNESAVITINGRPIQDYTAQSLHSCMGWIPQNPSLISGTLRELFLLTQPRISEAEMASLLDRVGLKVNELPHGIDTHISGAGEKSGDISGGQRRRIAIARALAVNPSLIIADEPTADLDAHSAKEILDLLNNLTANGMIVIAVLHTPNQVLANAHEIVMEQR
jgi:ABC-type transport system involved in cytochrome bd biosynthesis fused ATPase/permease subunit